jgi:hypothetical protein
VVLEQNMAVRVGLFKLMIINGIAVGNICILELRKTNTNAYSDSI